MTGAEDKDASSVAAVFGCETARFPATRWQKFYWRIATDPARAASANVAMRWRIIGDLSEARCEAALRTLIERHEILRTGFTVAGDGLTQIVVERGRLHLARVDLQRLAHEARESEADRIAAQIAREPFDPSQPSLIRALALRLSPDEQILCLTFSRLILDGWSIGLLIEEFGRLASGSENSAVEPPALHFGDFALWQSQALSGPEALKDASEWRRRLSRMPDAFTLAPDPAPMPEAADSIIARDLPASVSAAFDAYASSLHVTPFALGLGLLSTMLAKIGTADVLALSTELAGREEPLSENIIGPLINLAPLVIEVGAAETVQDVVRAAAQAARDTLAGEMAPFAGLDQTAEDIARIPRLHFVLQRSYIHADSSTDPVFGDIRLQSLPSFSTGALWDMCFFMVQREGRWRLSIEWRGARYAQANVERLLGYWSDIVASAVGSGATTLEQLPPPGQVTRAFAYHERRQPLAPIPAQSADITRLRSAPNGASIVALNIASIYFPLAAALGETASFYDLSLEAAKAQAAPDLRYFGDIARDCAMQIAALKPDRPLVLFGFCIAGALALETARRLRAQGQDVAFVVLCDTWRPGFRERMSWADKQVRLMQIRVNLLRTNIAKLRAGEANLSYVLRSWPLARRLALAEIGEWLGLLKAGPALQQIDAENRPLADYLYACQRSFSPQPYDGDVLLFRSAEVLKGRLFPHEMGWREIVGDRLEVIDCPGLHNEMFRGAGGEVIAQALRERLRPIVTRAAKA